VKIRLNCVYLNHIHLIIFGPKYINMMDMKLKLLTQDITNDTKETRFQIGKDFHSRVLCCSVFNSRKMKLCMGIKETQVISRIFFQAEDVRRMLFFNLQLRFQLLPSILSPTITKQKETESVVCYFTTVDFNRFVSRFQTFLSSSNALRIVMFPFSSQG